MERLRYIDLLAEKRPKAFVLENVKQLVGHDNACTLKRILETLHGLDVD